MSKIGEVRDMLLNAHVTEQAMKEKDDIARAAVEEFLKDNEERVAEFAKRNPGQLPPVYYLENERRVVWLNRQQARKLKRNQRKYNVRDLYSQSSVEVNSDLTQKNNKQAETPREEKNER